MSRDTIENEINSSEEKINPATVLPKDVFHLLMNRVPLQVLVASSQVSTQWHALTNRDDHWEPKCEK
jgi:hypothetical protein